MGQEFSYVNFDEGAFRIYIPNSSSKFSAESLVKYFTIWQYIMRQRKYSNVANAIRVILMRGKYSCSDFKSSHLLKENGLLRPAFA